MNRIVRYGFFTLVFAVFVAIVVLLVNAPVSKYADPYEQGKSCYYGGASSEANPYTGTSSRLARRWLEGWIDAKQEKRVKELTSPIP